MAQAAAQAQVDLDGLNDCLTVCGLRTAALRNGITVREGKRSLEEFGQFQPDDIPELVKSLARNAPTNQRVYYSFTQQKNLQTLSFWVQERLATNQPLDAALWTAVKVGHRAWAVGCSSRGFVAVAVSSIPKTRPFGFTLSHLCLFEGAPQYGADCL